MWCPEPSHVTQTGWNRNGRSKHLQYTTYPFSNQSLSDSLVLSAIRMSLLRQQQQMPVHPCCILALFFWDKPYLTRTQVAGRRRGNPWDSLIIGSGWNSARYNNTTIYVLLPIQKKPLVRETFRKAMTSILQTSGSDTKEGFRHAIYH